MNRLKDNLVVQFSVASFVILSVLAVTISVILSVQLNRNIALLQEHGAAMMTGGEIQPTDPFSIPSLTDNVRNLQRITVAVVGGSFVVLYGTLVFIVWKGWQTIARQQSDLEEKNAALQSANEQLEEQSGRLQRRTEQLDLNQRAIRIIFAASKQSDPDEILGLVVNMIRDQFDLYHVQIFIIDEEQQAAVLKESTGYAGRQLLQQGHHIPFNQPALVARAIEEDKAIIVDDVSQSDVFLANPLLPETKAEVVVPLRLDDRVIGILDAQSSTRDTFNRDMVTLFQTMADQIALLLENSRLLAQVSKQNEALTRFTTQLSTASELGQRLSAIHEPEELLDTAVALIQSRFGFYHVHIYVLHEEEDELVVHVGSGEVGRVLRDQEHSIALSAEKSLVARAARTQEVSLVNDVSLESDFLPNPLLPQTRAEVAVPLVVRGNTIGVLDVQDDQKDRFGESDVNALTTLAGQVATALNSAHLFDQLQQTLQRTRLRLNINQALAGTRTEEEVLDTILDEVAVYDDTAVLVLLRDDSDGTLEVAGVRTVQSSLSLLEVGVRFPADHYNVPDNSIEDLVFYTPNASQDERLSEGVRDLTLETGAVSVAAVRIQAGENWLGMLIVASQQQEAFADYQLDLFKLVAERGALALREARLRERLMRISRAVESTNEAIIITDTDGAIIYHNRAFLDVFGEAPAVGDTVATVYDRQYDFVRVPSGERYRLEQLPLLRTLSSGEYHSADDLGIRAGDGTFSSLRARAGPVFDRDGHLIGATATYGNMTEHNGTSAGEGK